MNTIPNKNSEPLFANAGRMLLAVILFCALGVAILFAHKATQPGNARMAMASGDYGLAAQYYEEAALRGDHKAGTSLANLYYLGLGVPKDYTRAGDLYYAAASAGVADAQLNLGHMYKLGLGIDSDPMRAFAWYNMADRWGNPAAEKYMKQISQEWTLSPLQINTALTKWSKLSELTKEGFR